jgi:archaellum component FlaF (FlaF/FlaG flagellin family)
MNMLVSGKARTQDIMTMRNLICILILFVSLSSCFTNPTEVNNSDYSQKRIRKSTNFKWVLYRDTVNVGFVMTFKYHDNLVAESIENGRCVGEPIKSKVVNGSVTNSMRWCIWMNDLSETESIDSLISLRKYIFKGQVTEQRENIMLNDIKAIRVTLTSNDKKDPYRQMIYFKKYTTLFEIVNNYSADKDFEIFYNSLSIDEIKKPNR